MPDDDLTIHTPGDTPVAADPNAAPALDTSTDSPEVAALKAENQQLRATVEMLNQQLMDAAEGHAAQQAAAPREPRLIGEDWSNMTAAQAHAKGCKQRVLCMDGYYIPD